MYLEQVRSIREYEVERAAALFPRGCHVLEIGAGAGWQAQSLGARGFQVDAIDVPGGNYESVRVWPVRDYDGIHIPFDTARFDVVFSSNVLEHVVSLDALEREIHRVLKRDGRAIHVLPTSAWRAWTNLTHYPSCGRAMMARLTSDRSEMSGEAVSSSSPAGLEVPGFGSRLRSLAIPSRHGEAGNALTELYHFSALRWRRHFEEAGWQVEQRLPIGLFYSGHLLMGRLLSLPLRMRLSAVLGSACAAYVLRPRA